jgi:hypothetical protein
MKTFKILFTLLTFSFLSAALLAQQPLQFDKLNTAVDNMGYWKAAAEHGLTAPNPQRSVPAAIFTGSEIRAVSVLTDDSPDVVLISGSTSQSENSIFVNPNDENNPLNSNNSTNQPSGGITLYGADYLYSFDAGESWEGSIQGAAISNSGDPTTAISTSGRYFVGYITNSYGMGVSYSDNQGSTWTAKTCAPSPGGSGLDKNHMWIDNSPTSPYEGNLYNTWTSFGGSNNNDIEISRSTDGGDTWSGVINISQSCGVGHHAQGVNAQTGPNGEVYVAFCIYDNWPSDEDAIGFARSFDGGATYESFRIIDNIKGIRSSGVGKNMRVNSFPVMACDISTGPNRGNIYVTWTNIGYPGTNGGNDADVYMIRSEDHGDTWSDPIRVNQDPSGQGKKHYSGWITADAATGTLSMVWYDDREVTGSQVETFCGNSFDAGDTWEDFKVSDVAFAPSPIPGLASQYFGDYLGISARNGKVYPVWTDNRTGTALTYTSPYVTSTMVAPSNLVAQLTNEETGAVNLTWTHNASPTFDHYNIYRGLQMLGTTTLPFYNDVLPGYGLYHYQVTAYYTIEGESGPAAADLQWGNGQAVVAPGAIEVFVVPEGTTSDVMNLSNAGELPLEYHSGFSLPGDARDGGRDYCTGIGGCGEWISGVMYGDVSNFSGCNGYEDFSSLTYLVNIGQSFDITINNSTNIYPADVCGIWVDWNHNNSLIDDTPVTVNGSPGPGPYTATITVPDDAKNGTTRMRIRIRRGGTLSPCGSAPNGEVEDYSLNVLGWVTASPMSGTVPAGSAQDITFNFDAAGLAVGTYEANYTIYSNDPDGDLVVPVTMHVAETSVNITADKDSLCLGGSTTLHANVTGGSGNFTYSWTSNPPGFTSSEPNPLVTPLVTTTYFVEVSDGSIILNNQITITVINLPYINLGQDVSVCESGEAIFDAGPGFASYIWSTGQTGQSIIVTQPGIYWVEVANDFGCASRDSVTFTVYPLPTISLGDDHAFCEGTPNMLSAGTGFASYLWNTGANSYYINTDQPGEYWVEVTDENGCSNRDTIVLTMNPKPVVDLGPDQTICQGTFAVLNAGNGFASYLWNTGAITATIEAGEYGEYWVEVTDANTCSNRDTIVLTMDPLPVGPVINSGPSSVDNFVSTSSDFTASESANATSYEWQLLPVEAGSISGSGLSAQVNWSAGYIGTAQVSVRGLNDCGAGPYSQTYPVSVYSSQGIGDQNPLSGIKLFPNPNDGIFVLQLNSKAEQEIRFQITASGGNQILESKESIPAGLYQKNFNLSTLPGGTYYLVISDSHGKMMSRQQVVIQ